MVHTSDYIHLNSFSDKGLSPRAVVMFGRYDSKFVLLGGILSAGLKPNIYEKLIGRFCYNFFISDFFFIDIWCKLFGD